MKRKNPGFGELEINVKNHVLNENLGHKSRVSKPAELTW